MKLQLVVVSKKLDIFALLFFSYAWALKRDYDRLEEVSKRVDVNPLGRLVLTGRRHGEEENGKKVVWRG